MRNIIYLFSLFIFKVFFKVFFLHTTTDISIHSKENTAKTDCILGWNQRTIGPVHGNRHLNITAMLIDEPTENQLLWEETLRIVICCAKKKSCSTTEDEAVVLEIREIRYKMSRQTIQHSTSRNQKPRHTLWGFICPVLKIHWFLAPQEMVKICLF